MTCTASFSAITRFLTRFGWAVSRSSRGISCGHGEIASKSANGGVAPENVTVAPARLATEKYVALDHRRYGRGRSSRRDSHSEHLMDLARLQAWDPQTAKRSE